MIIIIIIGVVPTLNYILIGHPQMATSLNIVFISIQSRTNQKHSACLSALFSTYEKTKSLVWSGSEEVWMLEHK